MKEDMNRELLFVDNDNVNSYRGLQEPLQIRNIKFTREALTDIRYIPPHVKPASNASMGTAVLFIYGWIV
jgi:hypothetical protein